jgi:hypothetical protein
MIPEKADAQLQVVPGNVSRDTVFRRLVVPLAVYASNPKLPPFSQK